jgi:hypothetical protein
MARDGRASTMERRTTPAIIGTDALGRPKTDEERDGDEAVLIAHDFAGARLIALRYAYTRRRSDAAAQDLLGRALLRLVRQGWDPAEVPLAKRLCRLVWSEWTNELSETDAARNAVEIFLANQEMQKGATQPSVQDQAIALEDVRAHEGHAHDLADALRASFEKAGDVVNLEWLAYWLAGKDDIQEMARRSQREPREFYLAAERRKRHVQRILAAIRGADDVEKP